LIIKDYSELAPRLHYMGIVSDDQLAL